MTGGDAEADAAVVRSSFDALNARDIDAVLGHFHRDCVFDASRVMEGTYHGHDEYRRFLEDMLGSNELRWDVVRTSIRKDSILVVADVSGAGSASGVPVERRFGFRYWIADGLIKRQEVHRDVEALLADLGEAGA